MKARPILFSGPMVRALIGGRKTQTRRVMSPQPEGELRPLSEWSAGLARACHDHNAPADKLAAHSERLKGAIFPFSPGPARAGSCLYSPTCPYGRPGDLLWVRETWYHAFRRTRSSNGCVYRADDNGRDLNPGWSPNGKGGGWIPSIHMHRWASRLTLRITNVRVQRLQEISGEDVDAEGVGIIEQARGVLRDDWKHTDAFQRLWESINGAGAWDANPWVWALTFEVIQKNVDEVLRETA